MTRTSVICQGALDHRPLYAELDKHHARPKYLAALLGVPIDPRTVPLCARAVIKTFITSFAPSSTPAPTGTIAYQRAARPSWTMPGSGGRRPFLEERHDPE